MRLPSPSNHIAFRINDCQEELTIHFIIYYSKWIKIRLRRDTKLRIRESEFKGYHRMFPTRTDDWSLSLLYLIDCLKLNQTSSSSRGQVHIVKLKDLV